MSTPSLSQHTESAGLIQPASRNDRVVQIGLVSLLLFGPLAFGATESWAIFVMQATSAVLFAIWALGQAPRAMQPRWNPLFAPMVFFGLLILTQMVSGRSAYAHATFAAAMQFVAYALICFLATQVVQRSAELTSLGWILSGYGFLVSVFALVQSLTNNGRIYWVRDLRFGGWIFGPYVNHNHYAGLMELLTPVPMAMCLSRRIPMGPKILLAFAGVFMASTIVLSGSRGGMIALAFQLVLLLLFLVISKRLKRAPLLIAFCAAAALLWILWVGGDSLADRIATLHSGATSELSAAFRITVARDCLRMFAERPVLGWGLHTFPTIYPHFQSFFTDGFVNQAHNDYAQLLVEMGSLGFLAMLWFVAVVARGAWQKLRGNNLGINGCAALAGILGVAGILVHSFFDFNLQIPANAALFYALATITASLPIQEQRRRNQSVRL